MSRVTQKDVNDSVIDLFHVQKNRLDAIEDKLAEFEDYFNTIESILTKIQAVYEAIKEQGNHE